MSARLDENENEQEEIYTVELRVLDVWKGVRKQTIRVNAAWLCCQCGYKMGIGEEYLVYADRIGRALYASTCSRTKPLEEAREDISELGQPIKTFRKQR